MSASALVVQLGRREYRLKMPVLLSPILGQNLSSYKKKDVAEAHEGIYRYIQGAFNRIGAPALRPIEIKVLDRAEFERAFRDCNPANPDEINFEAYDAFAYSVSRGGELSWRMFYNRDSLETNGVPTTSIMAHEICATLYGGFSNTQKKLAGSLDKEGFDLQSPHLQRGLSAAGEGWAVYLSSSPRVFSPQILITIELGLLGGAIPREEIPAIARLLSNSHVFVCLALAKLEMAEGRNISRLVSLMHEPPMPITADPSTDRIIEGFWQIYREANMRLGMGTIPRELILVDHPDPSRTGLL